MYTYLAADFVVQVGLKHLRVCLLLFFSAINFNQKTLTMIDYLLINNVDLLMIINIYFSSQLLHITSIL